jgi:predicted secreted protein
MKLNVKIGLVLIVVLSGYLFWQISNLPEETEVTKITPQDGASCQEIDAFFECEEGGWIEAFFYNCDNGENYADLVLSDGRDFRVYQTISASGARYLSQDGMIEFWNKGDDCFIRENEEETFNCFNVETMLEEEVSEIIMVGESTIIELEENPTTGYEWHYTIDGEDIIEIVDDSYQANENAEEMVGVGGIRKIEIKGIKKGLAIINLEYSQEWSTEEPIQTEEFRVKVE